MDAPPQLIPTSSDFVVFDRTYAHCLGINAAIILSRIVWSINKHIEADDRSFFKEDRWWMYDSRGDLAHYSSLTDKQIKLALKVLREKKIIESNQFDHQFGVRRNWFTVNVSCLLNELTIGPKGTNTLGQKGPIHWAKRDQYIGPKGTNTASLLRISAQSPTQSHPKSPLNLVSLPDIPPEGKKAPPFHSKGEPMAQLVQQPKKSQFTPEDLEIARRWLTYAMREMPWKTPPPTWTEKGFGRDIAKVRRVTGLTSEGMGRVLAFVEGDDFWVKNALTPGGLLTKSKNGNRKIDNILLQMRPASDRQMQKIMEIPNLDPREMTVDDIFN